MAGKDPVLRGRRQLRPLVIVAVLVVGVALGARRPSGWVPPDAKTCPMSLAFAASPVPTLTPWVVVYDGVEQLARVPWETKEAYATDIFVGVVLSTSLGTPAPAPSSYYPSQSIDVPTHFYEVRVTRTWKGSASGIVRLRQWGVMDDQSVYRESPVASPGDSIRIYAVANAPGCFYDLIGGADGYHHNVTRRQVTQTAEARPTNEG